MIKITRTSTFTSKTRTLEMPVTHEQLKRYERGVELIQSVFPDLTPADREFIKTGVASEEWDKTFK